uniref:Uncharacterized protein n=1 Tax=Zea mays TaxID=4577 RepID=A0A804PSL8_MAIZE
MLELLARARAGRCVPAGDGPGTAPSGAFPGVEQPTQNWERELGLDRRETESKLANRRLSSPPRHDPRRAFAPQGPVAIGSARPADAPRRAASKLPSQRAAC